MVERGCYLRWCVYSLIDLPRVLLLFVFLKIPLVVCQDQSSSSNGCQEEKQDRVDADDVRFHAFYCTQNEAFRSAREIYAASQQVRFYWCCRPFCSVRCCARTTLAISMRQYNIYNI